MTRKQEFEGACVAVGAKCFAKRQVPCTGILCHDFARSIAARQSKRPHDACGRLYQDKKLSAKAVASASQRSL